MQDKPTAALTLPGWPTYAADETAAVQRVLESGQVNYWTGDEGTRFEREYADYLGLPHAIVLANGTLALELALRALGIGVGDEVIVTPRSFIASVSSIVVCGARPVFADIDRDSQNITAETIAPKITKHTRAIVLVHLAGWPCDMNPILELAEQHDIKVIEDCAQAHGAMDRQRHVGSMGDIAAFSFCQDKIITTGGEGGLLAMRSDAAWDIAWSYKDHGKKHATVFDGHSSTSGAFRWVHESIGSNLRMTEMQAAIGRIQLRKLNGWITTRRRNAQVFIDRLSGISALRIPLPGDDTYHSYYKFYVFLQLDRLRSNWSRDRIIDAVKEAGVPCFGGSCSEIYLEKAFSDTDLRPNRRLPVARELGNTSIMLLVHPTLSIEDMHKMADIFERVMKSATI